MNWVGKIILICFFFSGMSSLIYESIWLRMLVLIFGSTTLAVSTVLTAFMGGLALGSLWFGRIIDRWPRPLLAYAILEISIGIYGLLVPYLFPLLVPLYQSVWDLFHPSQFWFNVFRFLLIFSVLLIPTILMGATLPVLASFFKTRPEHSPRQIGTLYALNTFGAVVGVFITGFLLLPQLGVEKTTGLAVLINLILGLGVYWISIRKKNISPAPSERNTGIFQKRDITSSDLNLKTKKSPWNLKIILALLAFALSGYTAMVYQVVWTRVLSLVLGSSIYAFSAMLTIFLIGLTLGSTLFSQLIYRIKKPIHVLALVQCGIAISCYAGSFLLERISYFFIKGMSWGLPAFFNHPDWLLFFLWFLSAFAIMFVPTLLFGGTFPLAIKIYQMESRGMGQTTGDVYFINTIGAVFGAFMGGFILIPTLGLLTTLLFTLLINLFLGVLLFLIQPEYRLKRKVSYASATGLLVLGLLWIGVPWNKTMMTFNLGIGLPTYMKVVEKLEEGEGWEAFNQIMEKNRKIEFYEEGRTGTVTVVSDPLGNRALMNNGRPEGGEGYLRTHVLLGHLPLLLGGSSQNQQKNLLTIGLGSGVTLGSTQKYSLSRLDAVELESAVVRASKFFNNINELDWEDPRLKIIINDGRNHLLTNREPYDIIISQPSMAWLSGVANLFTQDFFQLGSKNLREGGIFGQWISIYGMTEETMKSIFKAFNTVFPYMMVFDPAPPDLILVGSSTPLEIDLRFLQEALENEALKKDLQRIGIDHVFDLLSTFAIGSTEIPLYFNDAIPNTDDNAWVEVHGPLDYYSGRINGQPAVIRKEMLNVHNSITHYIKDFSKLPEGMQQDFFLKLAWSYYKQDTVNREDSLGYAHYYANRSMRIRETPQGHLLMARLLISFSQKITREGSENNPTPYLQGALKAIKKALDINPDMAEGHLLAGNLQVLMGDTETGMASYKKSITLNSVFPEPHFRMGNLLQSLGQLQEAKEYYKSFLKVVPQTEVSREWVDQAKRNLQQLK